MLEGREVIILSKETINRRKEIEKIRVMCDRGMAHSYSPIAISHLLNEIDYLNNLRGKSYQEVTHLSEIKVKE